MRGRKVKKIVFIIMAITLMVAVCPKESVKADDGKSVFNGLFLINGDVDLQSVMIDISVDNAETSRVTATYEMTNAGKETQYLTLGTPVTSLAMTNYESWFTPYLYNSVIVNGSKINQMMDQVDVDFDNWRNYSFEIPLKPGETKSAKIIYTTQNKQDYTGKVTFDMDMNHLKTWGKQPENVNVKANFNAKTVKIYNFDHEFKVEPTEITLEYGYVWKLSGKDMYKDISFDYYFVDDEIIQQLSALKSGQINTMIASYNSKNYAKVIESGKNYIASSNNDNDQNKVYLLMADAYVALKQYDEALAVYDLIETELSNFGEIAEKIESKILYNKVICYKELNQYEDMYDLIDYELNYSNPNTYIVNWLEKQLKLIPEKQLTKIRETHKELTSIQKVAKKFLQGEFHIYLFVGLAIVIIIVLIILSIRRKRRKSRFFF